MSVDGDGDNLRELNHRLRSGNQRIKDGVVTEDGFRVNGTVENIKAGHEGAVQTPPASLEIVQQQQSQGTMVCWERFLNLRSLKVLLVENDDSTRHVVTALLRNCSYEVTEAANGFQAWKVLEDLTTHMDLVLTEVVMPGLSGIGLLCKIMNHKTRKNLPVIMMSSHDSMGLVFKCLSKGAVDFLVKPIRKNELKNLWQHVWRRCHSSSGSGSESGTQTQKSVKSKGVEKSDNNSGSNDEDDNESISLNAGDGSYNGSGTQSSWTKQAVEVDSPLPVSPSDQVAECPDSTCAQVIHSNASGAANCKDLEKDVLGNLDLQLKHQVENSIKIVSTKQKNLLEGRSSNLKEEIDKGHLDLNSATPPSRSNYEVANLTRIAVNTISDPNMKMAGVEASNRQSKISDIKNKGFNDFKETSSSELSLKRLRGAKDVGATVPKDRNVLRRSNSSAFSSYNASSNANKVPGASGSPRDSALDKTRKGSVCELKYLSNGNHTNRCSNVGSHNIDMGSTTNQTFPESVILKNRLTVSPSAKYLHPPSTFQPSNGDLMCLPQPIVSEKADDSAGKKMHCQPRDIFQEHLCQHLSHNHDHHLSHIMLCQQHCQQPQLPPDHDDSVSKKMAAVAPHCGSSNVLGGPVEGTCGNYSVNGSASGSNHGSNHGSSRQNGSSTAFNAGGINGESDNGNTGKSGSGDGSGSRSGSGAGNRVDQNKFSQREAALTKFRLKRKERCFQKKVRYQSRKRLAEQRPRVRGQFVRHTANESTSKAEDG